MRQFLEPEDYLEPVCVLCDSPGESGKRTNIQPIPLQRVIDRLDSYMSRRDYEGAEKHLLYWLQEAVRGHDQRGQLMVCNELIGYCRKTNQRDKAFQDADQALRLLDEMNFDGTISSGTTCVNIATAYQAFGEYERSLELFEKAEAIYESSQAIRPHQLGGLYNNMALTFKALARYPEAFNYFEKAMDEMGKAPGGVLEQAITCLNMADAVAERDGLEAGEEKVFSLLDKAYDLLRDESAPHDGYYAFVCEKCAPAFSYYGYFAAAEELQKTAERIYERA